MVGEEVLEEDPVVVAEAVEVVAQVVRKCDSGDSLL